MGQHSEKHIEEYEAQMDRLADDVLYNEHMEQKWEDLEKQSLSAINQFQKGLTKVDIKEMAGNVIENLLINGNPLQIAEALSAMELFIKEVKDDPRYKNYVREEISKNKGGYVSKSGAKLEAIETGTVFNYAQCNDPKMDEYFQELEDANNQVKIHQAFLKTVPIEGIEVVRGDLVVRIFPPSKTSVSSYKCTLSKGF